MLEGEKSHRIFGVLLVLLYAAAVGYLVMLPLPPIVQRVYVDENALMPGAAGSRINDHALPRMQEYDKQIAVAGRQSADALQKWVKSAFRQAGLDTFEYVHDHSTQDSLPAANFPSFPGLPSLTDILPELPGQSRKEQAVKFSSDVEESVVERTMVTTGILRAPKGDGKECIVLVVEYDSSRTGEARLRKDPIGTASALSAALTLLQHLAEVKWLQKDIVLVAVQRTGAKAKAVDAFRGWVHTYHSANHLPGFKRAGNILAALVLDIPFGVPYSRLSILPGGQMGLLPNLDIVSVVARLIRTYYVPLTVCESASTPKFLAAKTSLFPFLKRHRGILRCMLESVSGKETGYHGHLLNFNVDALTLRGVPSASPMEARSSLTLVRGLEVTLRSFNNLIEKLHHSTFLYVLVSPTEFTTMEKYVYVAVLLCVPLNLYGFFLLFTSKSVRWLHSLHVLLLVYTPCVVSFALPAVLSRTLGIWNEQVVALWLCLTAASFATSLCVFLGLKSADNEQQLLSAGASSTAIADADELVVQGAEFAIDWRLVKAFSMIFTQLTLSPIAIINFPLAVTLLLLVVPLMVGVTPLLFPSRPRCLPVSAYVFRQTVHVLILLVFSPASVLLMFSLVSAQPIPVLLQLLLQHLVAPASHLLLPLFALLYLPAYLISSMLFWSPCCLSRKLRRQREIAKKNE